MRNAPSVLVAVLTSILFISPDARGGGVFPSPEPVSPGAPETVRLIADRCPTFSWSGVPGAWGYEIAIFSAVEPAVAVEPAIDGTVAREPIAIDPDSTEPLVRAKVPAGTSSWTPSLEQCLVQGREYSWFIRETASPGRSEGAWSAASSFAVAESMVPPDQQREIDELIERLEALAVGFGESSGDTTLQPEFLIDDVYNWLTSNFNTGKEDSLGWYIYQGRNYAANVHGRVVSMQPQVGAMAPQLQQIIDIVQENLEFIDASSSAPGAISTEAGRRPVRDAIKEAKATLKFILDTQFTGKAEFLAGGCATGSGSDCALFKERLTGLLAAFEDLVNLASELSQPENANLGIEGDLAVARLQSPVSPEVDLSRLTSLIEQIPAPAIYPLYRLDSELGLTGEVEGLQAAIDDIRFLQPILTNTPNSDLDSNGIQPDSLFTDRCGWLHDPQAPNREQMATFAGYKLKAVAFRAKLAGKLIEAGTTTKITPQAGVHGYAGATIDTDVPGALTGLMDGIESVLSYAGDKVLTTISDCNAMREQQARDALLQSISDGLPSEEQLNNLEGLSSVPSDVVLTKTDVGLVKEDVVLVKTDVGLVKEDVVLTKTDVGLVKEDVVLVKEDVGLVKEDVGLVKEDVVLTKTEVGLVKEDVGLVKEDVVLVKTDIGLVKEDVGLVKTDVGRVKEDVVLTKTDVGQVKEDVVLVKTDVGLVKTDLGLVKTAVDDTKRVTNEVKADLGEAVGVLEGLSSVPSVLESTREDVGLVKTDVGLVKTAVDDTKRVTDEVKADLGEVVGVLEGLSSVPSVLDSTREDVGRVKTEVGLIKIAVDDTKRVADEVKADLGGAVGILAAHDGRLTDLGTAVSSHDDAVQDGLEALVTRLEAVEADNEALRRARIESHIGSCTPTLGLLLPAVHGGQLETVIETVEEAIGTAASIGMTTSKAEKSFAKGQQSVSDQAYGAAFDWFCDAYQSLLN